MSAGHLDPALARRVANLTYAASRAVEGLLSGVHRSPHRGASVVFVEHREYRPGDDLRLLDWRAYARSDRHQIKRFEQETQLRATLVMDRSGSMTFGGPGRPTKAEHAATLLGALAFLLQRQGDATGLAVMTDVIVDRLPPRTRPAHVSRVLAALAAPAEEGSPTDLAAALSMVAESAPRRGLIAVASDLLDLEPRALEPLSLLRARGHDVLVFHVLDPDELELPLTEPSRVLGLEGEDPIDVDPAELGEAYAAEVARFLESCHARCVSAGARYVIARTDAPPEQTLAAALRGARRRGFG